MEDKKDFLFRFISLEKRKQIQMDEEAFYSVTDQYTADRISKDLLNVLPDVKTVTDATACIGGNTYSFSKFFPVVQAIELDTDRFHYLQHNLEIFETQNVIPYCGDLTIICLQLYQDLIFIDPPWGGPHYKSKPSVDLYVSDIELSDVCEHIKDATRYIALKVPVNFNEEGFLIKTKGFLKLIHRNPDLRKMHLLVFEVLK